MNIVISQSMLFPWIGMLEQLRLADVFVHYDDVQFSKGSFVNRVQLKFPDKTRWMTVPLTKLHLGQCINEVRPKSGNDWKQQHFDQLKRSLAEAPFVDDALELVEKVYSKEYLDIGSLARASMLEMARYFGIDDKINFVDVESMDVQGSSSERVLAVVKTMQASVYITGHGAARYLNHELFEKEGVEVRYIDYQMKPYPQLYGEFTPYVSGLDLVANCGRDGIQFIQSNTTTWKNFVK